MIALINVTAPLIVLLIAPLITSLIILHHIALMAYAPLIALMITLMIAPLIVPLPHSKGSFSFAQAPFNLLAHLIEKVQPAIERILHIYSTLIFFSSFINEILYNCHLLKHFCIFCSNLKNFTSYIFSQCTIIRAAAALNEPLSLHSRGLSKYKIENERMREWHFQFIEQRCIASIHGCIVAAE